MTTLIDAPSAAVRDDGLIDAEVRYAELSCRLGRYRDFCVALALLLFFGRSMWAWISGRSWIVGPEVGAVYVLGFPALFAFLGSRDLPAWLRLWGARRLARARRDRQVRPWQYVAAGAVLGGSVILAVTSLLRNL